VTGDAFRLGDDALPLEARVGLIADDGRQVCGTRPFGADDCRLARRGQQLICR
jgi:hypothetical protein